MTYRLSVKAGPVQEEAVTVQWASMKAPRLNGKLSVDFSDGAHTELSNNDKQIVAELTAIRHLLFRRKIWSSGVESGLGQGLLLNGEKVELTVSKGGIKRLARQDSHKHFLVPHVYYLNSRLYGTTISVSKADPDPGAGAADPEHARIEPYTAPYEPFLSHAVGCPIIITKHAYDRFAEPANYPYFREKASADWEPKNPRTTLAKHVRRKNGAMCIPLPEHVLKHKQRKYKNGGNEEHWALVGTDLVMILTANEDASGVKTVVTIYKRPKEGEKRR